MILELKCCQCLVHITAEDWGCGRATHVWDTEADMTHPLLSAIVLEKKESQVHHIIPFI